MDGSKCPLKPETSSSTKAVRAIACLALAVALVASAGCKSMADPDGSHDPDKDLLSNRLTLSPSTVTLIVIL